MRGKPGRYQNRLCSPFGLGGGSFVLFWDREKKVSGSILSPGFGILVRMATEGEKRSSDATAVIIMLVAAGPVYMGEGKCQKKYFQWKYSYFDIK